MSIKSLPHVAVDQVLELRTKAIEMEKALIETQRLLRSGANGAIVDTVWSDSEPNMTLYERIYHLTGEAV